MWINTWELNIRYLSERMVPAKIFRRVFSPLPVVCLGFCLGTCSLPLTAAGSLLTLTLVVPDPEALARGAIGQHSRMLSGSGGAC